MLRCRSGECKWLITSREDCGTSKQWPVQVRVRKSPPPLTEAGTNQQIPFTTIVLTLIARKTGRYFSTSYTLELKQAHTFSLPLILPFDVEFQHISFVGLKVSR